MQQDINLPQPGAAATTFDYEQLAIPAVDAPILSDITPQVTESIIKKLRPARKLISPAPSQAETSSKTGTK